MATSSIEWTDTTWNPVTGCDRVSAGCDNCYALTLARRLQAMGQAKYQADGDPRTSGPGFGLTWHADVVDEPLRWHKPRMIFVNSMSDLFHPDVPDEFIERVFRTMGRADRHTFQVLTKRPQRMARWVESFYGNASWEESGCPIGLLPNVWLGTSIENQRYTDVRIPHLLSAPAAVRFLSAEPLLGPIDLKPEWLEVELQAFGAGVSKFPSIDWVIVGGESGHHARPVELEWVRTVRDQCTSNAVPVFIKQLGTVWSVEAGHGRTHGGDQALWPADLRVREYPRVDQRPAAISIV